MDSLENYTQPALTLFLTTVLSQVISDGLGTHRSGDPRVLERGTCFDKDANAAGITIGMDHQQVTEAPPPLHPTPSLSKKSEVRREIDVGIITVEIT